ncbi:LysE family translocator [Aestuariirhabdus litorea]|uniref:LysE family translocator n=1 Tax=Aestuariirhabdus litorea TaxID=2528527 RepID=A0A3P3VLY0_9GAMM|nr:LysE family translocator [Aestuariirhabdus litorea]RRJ82878.1 LysE family translocator [Aestuariirhabdus litorea]RWW93037.1 LysE family translocator [Endozoicomonadaceae bacterium GTF-13]
MTLAAWLALAGVCLLGAVSPGPSLAVVLRHTLNHSRAHGMAVGVAHALGVGGYALLSVTGLAALFAHYPLAQQLLGWGGAAYLAWLGIKALRSEGSIGPSGTGSVGQHWRQAARDGLMISLLNPKLMIFFVALFSQFVEADTPFWVGVVMVLTPTLIDGGWYCLVAVLLSHRSVLERLRARAQLIDRVTGVFLLLLALRVVTL